MNNTNKILLGNLNYRAFTKVTFLMCIGFNLWIDTVASKILNLVDTILTFINNITFGISDTIKEALIILTTYSIISLLLSAFLWYQTIKAAIWLNAYGDMLEYRIGNKIYLMLAIIIVNIISFMCLKTFIY